MIDDEEIKLTRSENFRYEILYRIKLIEDAIGLYYFYGQGWNQRQRDDPLGISFRPEDQARYFAVQFAFLQIAAILDQQGEYSLCMQRKSFTISEKRLALLFPTLQKSRLNQIASDVNSVLYKHRSTINTIFKVRHSRIAHIGDITHKVVVFNGDWDYDRTYFKLQNNLPSSFRIKRVTELCRDLSYALFTI